MTTLKNNCIPSDTKQVQALHTNINKFTLRTKWTCGRPAPSASHSWGLRYEHPREETHSPGISAVQNAINCKHCLVHAGKWQRKQIRGWKQQRGCVSYFTNRHLDYGVHTLCTIRLSTKFHWRQYAFISKLTKDLYQTDFFFLLACKRNVKIEHQDIIFLYGDNIRLTLLRVPYTKGQNGVGMFLGSVNSFLWNENWTSRQCLKFFQCPHLALTQLTQGDTDQNT